MDDWFVRSTGRRVGRIGIWTMVQIHVCVEVPWMLTYRLSSLYFACWIILSNDKLGAALQKREKIAMSFNSRNTPLLRWLILALLVVAVLGPWMMDMINVPAQYSCDKPFVRLYGDFCGYPMSGFGAIAWITSGFLYTLNELIRGNIATVFPNLIALIFVCIIVFPFLSTILLTSKKTSRRFQIINLSVWGVACLASLIIFALQSQSEQFIQYFFLLWGLPLYIFVAIGAVVLEALVFTSSTRASQTI